MLPWDAEELAFDESRFSGTARLFPLPDLVMFPHVMQPLHIFEPRYREMLNDALDSDGLIAMSVLAPGWESDYEGRPPLLPHLCLGKVVTHQRLHDGRYNLMLLGLRRARLVAETLPRRAFRQAEVELLDDIYPIDGGTDRCGLQKALTERFKELLPLPKDAQGEAPVHELLASDVPLGVLADLISFALPLEGALKIQLLGECDVDRRARLLAEALGVTISTPRRAAAAASGSFPPRFSSN